jgi:hypothetical protein
MLALAEKVVIIELARASILCCAARIILLKTNSKPPLTLSGDWNILPAS